MDLKINVKINLIYLQCLLLILIGDLWHQRTVMDPTRSLFYFLFFVFSISLFCGNNVEAQNTHSSKHSKFAGPILRFKFWLVILKTPQSFIIIYSFLIFINEKYSILTIPKIILYWLYIFHFLHTKFILL